VPNLTTGGMEFTEENLRALKRYCGAVGLSMEGVGARYDRWRSWGFDNFQASLERMHDASIPTVLQITLSAINIHELDEITDFCLSHPQLYGVIFLAYKNVGRGTRAADGLGAVDAHLVSQALKRSFDALSPHMRVGYDCCMTPAIAGVEEVSSFVDVSNLEGCSATRGSVGVSTGLDVVPCTFTGGYPLGNLRRQHLRDIWQGAQSEAWRRRIHGKSVGNSACAGCGKRANCLGGCPVMPLANCHQDHLAVADFPGLQRPARVRPGDTGV
ncbi:MAG: SPASM domain-containing protein, partial [Planctomycetota bacterium]